MERSPPKHRCQEINILCIGQFEAGKTFFLQQYAGQQPDQGNYKIFVKQTSIGVAYLHELSEEQEVYIDQNFNGILFFIDIINSINAQTSVLKWLNIYSKVTGLNIFKIPFKVVVTKGALLHQEILQRQIARIRKQLSWIIDPKRIVYQKTDYPNYISQELDQFYATLMGYKRDNGQQALQELGLNVSPYVIWKLYGTCELLHIFWIQVRINVFRGHEHSIQKILKKKILAFKKHSAGISNFYK